MSLVNNSRPTFVDVLVSDLLVDDGYQRVEANSKTRHKRMADNWNWHLFGAPVVAKRGNKFSVVDGQNRLNALKMAFPDEKDESGKPLKIKCQLVPYTTPEQEAIFFCEKGTSSIRISANQRFKACLFAKCEEEVHIVKLLSKKGITISYGRGRPGVNVTKSPAAFRAAYDKLDKKGFSNLVECIWTFRRPENKTGIETQALDPDFVAAMTLYLLDTENLIKDTLTGLTLGLSAAEIIDRAKQNPKARCWTQTVRRNAIKEEIQKSVRKGLSSLR